MKLRHFLPAIALALPLASQAESEFSYDYLEFSTSYLTTEVEDSNDDLTANMLAISFSKELLFQVFTNVDVLYMNIDDEVDNDAASVELETNGYGLSLSLGRYFELHNRVNAVVTAQHTRIHSDSRSKVTVAGVGELKSKDNDVQLSYSIDTGLRVHLDSEKRFEFMPNITTDYYDGNDTDTTLELGFGFTPIKDLQLIATYASTPEKLDNSTFSAAVHWNF